MTTKNLVCMNILATLFTGGSAAAQTFESSTISIADATGSSCTIPSLSSAASEIRSEMLNLRSEADRMVCLSDGAVFATDMDGEVRVSILAPGADGVLAITDHYLTTEDTAQLDQLAGEDPLWFLPPAVSAGAPGPLPYPIITATDSASGVVDQFSDVCDVGTALQSADGRRLGWHEICDVGASLSEICDVGTSLSEICDVGAALQSADGRHLGWSEICDVGASWSEICDVGAALQSADGRHLGWSEICDVGTSLTLGAQEGEPVRAILDAMVACTNAPDSMYIDDASSNYTESRDEGLVYGAMCTNELTSGAQRPDDGLIAVVIITAVIHASN